MVIRSGKTAYSSTDRAFKAIDHKKLLGVMLNDVKPMPFQTYHATATTSMVTTALFIPGDGKEESNRRIIWSPELRHEDKVAMKIADESYSSGCCFWSAGELSAPGSRFALMLVDMEELGSRLSAGTMEESARLSAPQCEKQILRAGTGTLRSRCDSDDAEWSGPADTGVCRCRKNAERSIPSRARFRGASIFGSPAIFFRTMKALNGGTRKRNGRWTRLRENGQSPEIERQQKGWWMFPVASWHCCCCHLSS